MSWSDRIEQAGTSLVMALITACGGGLLWLVRRVVTNQKQIEMLQAEIRHRDEMRKADRDAVKEIKDDVKAMRAEIRDMFRRHE